jgi:GntR family transcriptional repressor for pyruvate dehydrogenase complex
MPKFSELTTMPVRPYSLTHRVAEEISQMILSSGLRPGDKLPPMAELEARLGVSHTVMREALRMLETRGLVQVQHGKGVIVSARSSDALSASLNTVFRLHNGTLFHLMEFRAILEIEVARLAAERRTDDNLREMRACLREMEQAAEIPRGYVDADVGFHNALVRATHNPVLISVTSSLQDLLIKSREITFRGPPTGATRALNAHRSIYEAVKARDAEGAASAMHRHLQETLQDIEIAVREGRLEQKL